MVIQQSFVMSGQAGGRWSAVADLRFAGMARFVMFPENSRWCSSLSAQLLRLLKLVHSLRPNYHLLEPVQLSSRACDSLNRHEKPTLF